MVLNVAFPRFTCKWEADEIESLGWWKYSVFASQLQTIKLDILIGQLTYLCKEKLSTESETAFWLDLEL